jgi:hypothetical protein
MNPQGYVPSSKDLAALEAVKDRAPTKYKRAPRNLQEAVQRAYQIIKDDHKEGKKKDFNASQVCGFKCGVRNSFSSDRLNP